MSVLVILVYVCKFLISNSFMSLLGIDRVIQNGYFFPSILNAEYHQAALSDL